MSLHLVLMSTGIEAWFGTNFNEIGPMYPFPGTEFLWFIVGLVTWLGWHLLQAKNEANEIKDEQERAKRGEHY